MIDATTAVHYDELAARLRITIAAAKRTVQRHRWRRTKDNHGRVLVHVPDEYLARRDDGRRDGRSAGVHDDRHEGCHEGPRDDQHDGSQARDETELLARLSAVQAELVQMAERTGAAESTVTQLRAQLAETQARADELRTDRDRWQRQAEEALRQLGERRPGLIERIAAVLRRAG